MDQDTFDYWVRKDECMARENIVESMPDPTLEMAVEEPVDDYMLLLNIDLAIKDTENKENAGRLLFWTIFTVCFLGLLAFYNPFLTSVFRTLIGPFSVARFIDFSKRANIKFAQYCLFHGERIAQFRILSSSVLAIQSDLEFHVFVLLKLRANPRNCKLNFYLRLKSSATVAGKFWTSSVRSLSFSRSRKTAAATPWSPKRS
ncbi:hypothetical protein L596_013235 [Steinernema carpocapsae]|uniref:Uncharacterized protein n=1 Tax=Steinernema carpocapsae TaxID=34508 RepID=A0A4U5NZJ1_STECR|nr:hypothetical protein L596_013235 [Steinernema carpocapsae]